MKRGAVLGLLWLAMACFDDATREGSSSAETTETSSVATESEGSEAVCGDGIRQGTEACDGDDFAENTCATVGLESGELGCTDQCTFDASGCSAAECGAAQACTPDQVENEPCGLCGTRTRLCSVGCFWGEWSECSDEGTCTPDAVERESCGSCGQRERVCDAACEWSEWSACSNEGVCVPGDSRPEPCGNCGSLLDVCSDDCEWTPGECMGEGPCAPGSEDVDTECANCGGGTRSRSCRNDCSWGPFSPCDGGTQCSGQQVCICAGFCGSPGSQCP